MKLPKFNPWFALLMFCFACIMGALMHIPLPVILTIGLVAGAGIGLLIGHDE